MCLLHFLTKITTFYFPGLHFGGATYSKLNPRILEMTPHQDMTSVNFVGNVLATVSWFAPPLISGLTGWKSLQAISYDFIVLG